MHEEKEMSPFYSTNCIILFLGEDWPGFDVPAVRSESLWDSEYNPVGNRWTSPDTSPTGGVCIHQQIRHSIN